MYKLPYFHEEDNEKVIAFMQAENKITVNAAGMIILVR
jgi:hypothetical protein